MTKTKDFDKGKEIYGTKKTVFIGDRNTRLQAVRSQEVEIITKHGYGPGILETTLSCGSLGLYFSLRFFHEIYQGTKVKIKLAHDGDSCLIIIAKFDGENWQLIEWK